MYLWVKVFTRADLIPPQIGRYITSPIFMVQEIYQQQFEAA